MILLVVYRILCSSYIVYYISEAARCGKQLYHITLPLRRPNSLKPSLALMFLVVDNVTSLECYKRIMAKKLWFVMFLNAGELRDNA